MLNVTKELTALARKLGYTGKAPDTVAKAINAITASVGEGGGEGGESEPLVVNIEYSQHNYGFKANVNSIEIQEAFNAGRPITSTYTDSGLVYILSLVGFDTRNNKLRAIMAGSCFLNSDSTDAIGANSSYEFYIFIIPEDSAYTNLASASIEAS